ncbi:MAG: carbohydrate ABC transporter permease [Oscillospiraceae bacterium]|jgi:raffinose/stachyose/melibiose transport system permease protein|nr:carbohydrate ABC transporter permease [Oscillospiraceae bacterium]
MVNTHRLSPKKSVEKGVEKKRNHVLLEIAAVLLFAAFMLPFIIVLLNSMRTNVEIINQAVGIPQNPAIIAQNVLTVWNNPTFSFMRAFIDSVIITAGSLALISLFSSMTAWVLVRNKTRWSSLLFMLYVSAMVIPFQVVMFPLISWFRTLGSFFGVQLLRTHAGLMFAYLGFGESLTIFIFHGFIKNVPLELEEAADIDGCTRAGTFFRVVLPLLQPVFVTVLVLNGLWIWNDYLLPLLILGSNSGVRTIPLAVQGFIGSFVKQWNLIMVSTMLAMIPIIIIYLLAQKYIVSGLVEGAIK